MEDYWNQMFIGVISVSFFIFFPNQSESSELLIINNLPYPCRLCWLLTRTKKYQDISKRKEVKKYSGKVYSLNQKPILLESWCVKFSTKLTQSRHSAVYSRVKI